MSRRAYSSVHMNSNLVCAIDTETTGLVVGKNDMIQLAIIPLTPDFKPNKDFQPFITKLDQKYGEVDPKAISVNKLLQFKGVGLDPDSAVDRFDEWFNNLRLPRGKGIVPLGHNYQFDQGFIEDWIGGPYSYSTFFRSDIRDTMLTALHYNDLAEWVNDQIPFPKVQLRWVARRLGVENPMAHDAVNDALVSAECYRRFMAFNHYFNPKAVVDDDPS